MSGYAGQPEKFEELLRILDKDLFLITPSEQGKVLNADGGHASGPSDRFYQLTHDFLFVAAGMADQGPRGEATGRSHRCVGRDEERTATGREARRLRLGTWAKPFGQMESSFTLGEEFQRTPSRQLGLLPVDAEQVNYLLERLLKADPHVFPVIRDALKPHREELVEAALECSGAA